MICSRCLLRGSSLRPQSPFARAFSSTRPSRDPATATPTSPRTAGPPTATSTGLAQPFSNPLSPSPNDISLGASSKSKVKTVQIPVSSCVAGTRLKGLNYIKGREDPVALKDDEYPEWLWSCLNVKKKVGLDEGVGGDEFSKSKKLRRAAAKRQRKLEAKLLASGDTSSLQPKIPLTQQSIDLPANEEGTVEGALEADAKRQELRAALREERRKKIKETNYLKSM